MKKKVVSVLLCATMVVSLATGCGSAAGSSSKTGSSDATASASTSASADGSEAAADTSASGDQWFASDIDTSEHVVINYVTTGNKPDNDNTTQMLDQLNKILTEKCNAEIQITYIEWTDYLTNYNLLLSSLDGSVDLVGTATDWLDAWPNAKKGAFLPLTEDMLSKYCPKTYAQVSAANDWDSCKYNGDIYLIPEDHYAQWTNHGFMYRDDYAKEAGLTSGVNSWDDMSTYFESVIKNHPDITPWDSDGTQYTTMASGWVASHTPAVSIDGLGSYMFYGKSKDDLYTVYSPFMDDDTLYDFADMMKKWNDEGVWTKDVLNNTGAATRDEFAAGQTAADQHHTQTWYSTDSPKAKAAGFECGFFYFGKETKNLSKLSVTHGAMAVSAASKNPERALTVYDLLRNDQECYRLFNYGIEGKQYTVTTTDGVDYLTRPEGYKEPDDMIVTDYWWGRNDDLELPNATWDNEGKKKMMDEYDTFAIAYPYGQFVIDTDPISSEISSMSEVWETYMPQIAFGQSDDPKALVDEFRSKMKTAGYDDVQKYIQDQMTQMYANK